MWRETWQPPTAKPSSGQTLFRVWSCRQVSQESGGDGEWIKIDERRARLSAKARVRSGGRNATGRGSRLRYDERERPGGPGVLEAGATSSRQQRRVSRAVPDTNVRRSGQKGSCWLGGSKVRSVGDSTVGQSMVCDSLDGSAPRSMWVAMRPLAIERAHVCKINIHRGEKNIRVFRTFFFRRVSNF